MVTIIHKLIYTPHYHLWTDALHARQLALDATDAWDRGSYVRWAINSAWTAFEMSCKDALQVADIKPPFKENLQMLLKSKYPEAELDWESKPWKRVARIYDTRIKYTHPKPSATPIKEDLMPAAEEATEAIEGLRDGIKAIYGETPRACPDWVDFDRDSGWKKRGGMIGFLQVGDCTPPDAVKITYVYNGMVKTSQCHPAGTNPVPHAEQLIDGMRLPITEVRAYEGSELVIQWLLEMRGT